MANTSSHRITLFSAFGALAAGLIIRITQVNPKGFWLDEIWSMVHSAPKFSAAEVISGAAQDSHPPLFDLLLHYWLMAFGTSEVTTKILPLLFALGSIYVSWFAALKITGNSNKAYFVLGLVSLNFFHIHYSTEVRFYSLMYLLSAVTLLQFWKIIQQGALKHYLWFVVSVVLLLYTHYYGAILLVVYSVVALTLLLMKQISVQTFGKYAIACVLIVTLFSPWIPYMFAKNNTVSWIEVPTAGTFFKFMYDYTGKNPLELLLYLFALIAGIRSFKTDKKLAVLTYSVVLLTFIIPFVISITGTSILHNRYLIITLPALFILAAHVFTEFTVKLNKVNLYLPIFLWIAMAANILFVNKIFREGKEPWKNVAEYYGKLRYIGKEIPMVSEQNDYIDYYLERVGAPKSVPYGAMGSLQEFWYLKHKRYTTQTPPDSMPGEYIVEQAQEFSHDFVLLKVKRVAK